MKAGLDRLLRPASITVIGGGFWCANVVRRCREMGFAGPIWPVHPERAEIAGERAFRSVDDLPGIPDAAFVGVNRRTTIEVVGALAGMGCGGAVCFAAGFAEARAEDTEATTLQEQLVAAAGNMPILGPNCYGFINYLDGALLWPDQHGGIRRDRGVAIVTQSSNMAINMTMARRGLPLAYMVTAGNQAQTGFAEIGQALIADRRVSALGLHIEGIGDIRTLEALAGAARKAGKPVIALKVGRSAAAQATTISHTASLAGSDAGAAALLDRLGIARVDDVPTFLEALKLAHVIGPLPSNRIASMSCSGGEASLMADLALPTGLEFPPLTDIQQSGLRAALGPLVSLANPLDYNTYIWPRTDAMAATFTAMMAGDLALGIVVLDFPRNDRCSAADWDNVIEAVVQAAKTSGKPMAILASLPENMPEDVTEALVGRGIVPLCGMTEGLAAVAAAVRLGRSQEPAEPVLLPGIEDAGRVLSEAEAKTILAGFGVEIPPSRRACGVEAAAEAAERLTYPVVLKGEGFAHKTETGAVRLNLKDAAEVRAAAAAMPARDFLVEQMVGEAVAEMIVGVVNDPAHGFVLSLGAGGTLTELLVDRANLLLPAPPAAVAQALDRLKIAAVLKGWRGGPAANMASIVSAVMAVQACVTARADRILEIEINPLICTPTRAVAADALIRERIE